MVFLDLVNGGETISLYVFVPHLTQEGPIFMQKLTLFTVAAKPLMEKELLFHLSSSKLILSYFFKFMTIIIAISIGKWIRLVKVTVN